MISIDNKTICPSCFTETTEETCPNCGYREGTEQNGQLLAPGTILNGKYIVGRSLGVGGFGITYLGYSVAGSKTVAIKEFFPKTLVRRNFQDTSIEALGDAELEAAEKGKEAFFNEAKTLARFNGHPHIVSVYEFFFENETAYFVMEYLEGTDLQHHVQGLKRNFTSAETVGMMRAVAEALMITHSAKVLHRDVSPANIFVCTDGTYKIIDFGAARQYSGEQTKSMSVILNPGFAPIEQYQRNGNQGPWTDIYALGATAYWCLTGQLLDDPMTRLGGDSLMGIKGTDIDPGLYKIVCKCISIQAEGRYQDAPALLKDMERVEDRLAAVPMPKKEPKPKPQSEPKPNSKRLSIMIASALAAVGVIALCTTAFITAARRNNANDVIDDNYGWTSPNFGAVAGTTDTTDVPETTAPDTTDTPDTTEALHYHSYGSWTNSGTTHTRTCSCGDTQTSAHTYDGGRVTREPTTSAAGVRTYTCTVCGATKTEAIEKLHTHSYGSWTNSGTTHTRTCSCGDTQTSAHTYDGGRVTREPTTSAAGVRTYTCTVCGATKTEAIEKLHTHSYGSAMVGGRGHTVGLKRDGTVVAVGNNDDGQCGVSEWRDIIAIASGAYHTVGLKKDGTVVAAGDNDYGQCDISEWSDIVAIAVGGYHTVGLKRDGTVVAVGHNDDDQCDVSEWRDIIAIAAGYDHTAGLKTDGTVVAVGHNDDSECDVSDWKNIVAISTGWRYTVGLKSDGTVVAIGYNSDGQCDVSDLRGIVAISTGWGHTIGLRSDGTAVAVGYNDDGECNVSDWRNIGIPQG